MKKKRVIPLCLLSVCISLSLTGCKDNQTELQPPSPPSNGWAPVLSPVMLSQVLPSGEGSDIDLSHAIARADGAQLRSVSLLGAGNEGCDTAPVMTGESMRVTPVASDSPILCAYKYTVGKDDASASSVVAFASANGKMALPSLPWVGVNGSVGETLTATIAESGTLDGTLVVLGDTGIAPVLNDATKTVSLTSTKEGVTRVMYTLTSGGKTQVGVIDFTFSADFNVAPVAKAGSMLLGKGPVTIDLAAFVPEGTTTPVALVHDRDADGKDTGTSGLSLTQVIAPPGVSATPVIGNPLGITVTAFYSGVFPVYYTVTDGDGGYASNLIYLWVEGVSGLQVSDSYLTLTPTVVSRSLTVDIAGLVQTASGASLLSIVPGSVNVTNKDAAPSTGFSGLAEPKGLGIMYTYGGNDKEGISHITYQVHDALTGRVATGDIFVSVGDHLPSFSGNTLTVTGPAKPFLDSVLTPSVTCNTASGCDETKTEWAWSQSGSVVANGTGAPQPYTVQDFPPGEVLELAVTPVAQATVNGSILTIEGAPVIRRWISEAQMVVTAQPDVPAIWFTSTPSVEFATEVGVRPDTSFLEDGTTGPKNYNAALFSAANTDKWCKALAAKGYKGRDDWSIPAKTAAETLFTAVNAVSGDGLLSNAWATTSGYWFQRRGRITDYFDMGKGTTGTNTTGVDAAMCMSGAIGGGDEIPGPGTVGDYPMYCNQFPGVTDLNCLPTVTAASGKVYTAAMSIQYKNAAYPELGNTEDIYVAPTAPWYGQTGLYVGATEDIHIRACELMNEKRQYGKNNWRIPTYKEINTDIPALTEHGVTERHGWPTISMYRTRGSKVPYMGANLTIDGYGEGRTVPPEWSIFVTCVSD